MINYPEIMKKFEDEPRIRSIAFDLNRAGFITKGRKISSNEVFALNSSNEATTITEKELESKQKNQINYLSKHVTEAVRENVKINNILIGASLFMITTSILVKVPLFGIAFAYFGGVALKDNLQIIKLNNQIKNDKWYSDNETEIEKRLDRSTSLYRKLSKTSKVILLRDGKITLNNIDEFPKNDLRLVRRNISREIKKKEKQKVKTLSR